MNKSLEIILDNLKRVSENIENNIDSNELYNYLAVYQNFFHQLCQITENMESIDEIEYRKLTEALEINSKIEKLLLNKKDELKNILFVQNKRLSITNRYFQSDKSMGYNKKS